MGNIRMNQPRLFLPTIVSMLLALSLSLYTSNVLAACRVNDADISGSYSGDCVNGVAHGKGMVIGRDKYMGEFENGNKHGQGTYTWGDASKAPGEIFVGEYIDDRTVKGILTSKSGEITNIDKTIKNGSTVKEQTTSSKSQTTVAAISTDEWKAYLFDILQKTALNPDRLVKLKKLSIDAMQQVSNNTSGSSREDIFRQIIRGYSLSWYVVEHDKSKNLIREREQLYGVRTTVASQIDSKIIDKSYANLLEILDPNESSNVSLYEISGEFQKIIIDRWNYDIPAKAKEIIKVKNYEFGSDVRNTLFRMCTPDNKNSWNERRQCNTDKFGTKFLNDFRYGIIENGIDVTVGEKGELLAINGTFPLEKAFELKDILTEKYGNSSYGKSEDYKMINRECANSPYITTHYFWKDVNGTVIQLDTTQFSIGSYKSCEFFGRITIMSKPYIDNIKDMLIKFNDQKNQEKEKEKKKAIDNL